MRSAYCGNMFTKIKSKDLNTPLFERIAKFQAAQQGKQSGANAATTDISKSALESTSSSRIKLEAARELGGVKRSLRHSDAAAGSNDRDVGDTAVTQYDDAHTPSDRSQPHAVENTSSWLMNGAEAVSGDADQETEELARVIQKTKSVIHHSVAASACNLAEQSGCGDGNKRNERAVTATTIEPTPTVTCNSAQEATSAVFLESADGLPGDSTGSAKCSNQSSDCLRMKKDNNSAQRMMETQDSTATMLPPPSTDDDTHVDKSGRRLVARRYKKARRRSLGPQSTPAVMGQMSSCYWCSVCVTCSLRY